MASEAVRALWAAGLGWALDSFDYYMYVYALPGVIAAFFLSRAFAGLLATETLAASAIGGIAMGFIADRIGRKRSLMISVAWYALFTALSGVAQNYTQLSIFRTLEGFGFGGEWAVGACLAAEWVGAGRRGRSLGLMQSGWAVGWLLANAAFQIVASVLGVEHGWRVLFFLGALPALSLLYIRRTVSEPEIYLESRRQPRKESAGLFGAGLARRTALATLLAIGLQSGYYALFTWMPSYLVTSRHLTPLTSGAVLYALIVGSFIGYLTNGMMNDAIGRRPTFVIFSLCSGLMVPLYLVVISKSWELLPAGLLLGYFASGVFSGFGPFLAELFPTGTRAGAQGFCYNIGRGVAGMSPFLVGLLSARVPIGSAMTVIAMCAYAIAAIAVLALPETKGTALETA
jgi:MFS family permease